MLLFSPLQVVRDRRVYVPPQMRAALGLHRETKVYVSTVDNHGAELANEVIVSAVPIKARDELWRLRVTFVDRPGILCELFHLLREEKIEVVSTRAHTMEQNRILRVELLLNTEFYRSRYQLGSGDSAAGPTLPELRARIIAAFIDDLDLPFGIRPMLSIRRNLPLYRSKYFIEDLHRSHLTQEGFTLPPTIADGIRHSLLTAYPHVAKLTGDARHPLACIVGDAENALLRVLVFYRHTGYVHIRVRARGMAECSRELTEILHAHGFNILQMYSRMLRHNENEESLTDFLLHLPPTIDRSRSDTKLNRYVWGIFKSKSIRHLESTVTFPELLRPGAATAEGQP